MSAKNILINYVFDNNFIATPRLQQKFLDMLKEVEVEAVNNYKLLINPSKPETTRILKICNNYPDTEKCNVTNCTITIQQNDRVVVLQQEELLRLADVINANIVAV